MTLLQQSGNLYPPVRRLVISQNAVSMQNPAGALARLEKAFLKRVFGSLLFEDPVAVVTAACLGVVFLRRRIHHVVDRTSILKAQGSWHIIEIKGDSIGLVKN